MLITGDKFEELAVHIADSRRTVIGVDYPRVLGDYSAPFF